MTKHITEICLGCGKKANIYKDALGYTVVTCFTCCPITRGSIRGDELDLCARSQYPKRPTGKRWILHKYYGRRIRVLC